MEQGRGYHAHVAKLSEQGRDCVSCHKEHVERDFQLIHWPGGIKRFDHSETGYPLKGKHATAECRTCHSIENITMRELRTFQVKDPERTFLGLTTSCGRCHEDEHRAQLGDDCSRCHIFDTWKDAVKFSHAESDFPLTGRHAQTGCVDCHRKTDTPPHYVIYRADGFASCKNCHEDKHNGAFRQDCGTCHSTSTWGRVSTSFDHSQTSFQLVGEHAEVTCEKCHGGIEFTKPIAHEKCSDCHTDDPHNGQFSKRADGRDCGACHNEEGFIPSLFTTESHQGSAYPLAGKHAAVGCAECHTPAGAATIYKIAFDSCTSCHKDAHEGQFAAAPHQNRCEDCHVVEGFQPATFTLTQHHQSRFDLVGAHLAVACSECHRPADNDRSSVNGRFHFETLDCPVCHEDPHMGQFTGKAGMACENCHAEHSWKKLRRFDHSATRFPLVAAHQTVQCLECHRSPDAAAGIRSVVFADAAMDCAGCHEDVHAGQFGESTSAVDCARCHTNRDWRPTEFDHDKFSSFSLKGAHEEVGCKQCHDQRKSVKGLDVTVYRGTPGECAVCHKD